MRRSLKLNRDSDGEEILPVLWEDNYFALLPGQSRQVTATYQAKDLGRASSSQGSYEIRPLRLFDPGGQRT